MKNKLHQTAIVFLCVIISACGSSATVRPTHDGIFIVTQTASSGFRGIGDLEAEATIEAQKYCAGMDKVPKIVYKSQTKPPYIYGNFPEVELQFKCIDAEK